AAPSASPGQPVALELGQETEGLHGLHAVEKDLPIEMVALVLDDAGVEALGGEAEAFAVAAVRLDADTRRAWDLAAQVGHAEAPFPVLVLLRAERCDLRIEQH